MIAYDTDILSELIRGTVRYVNQASGIPVADQWVPVVAAVEVLRGRMNAIRQAEAGRGPVGLPDAYSLLTDSLQALARYRVLPYTDAADARYAAWRAARVRIGTRDLRIAAICFTRGVTLVTRNARDFAQVPGLTFVVWN